MEKLKQLGTKLNDLLGRVPTRKIDLALAVIVTALGLVVYAYVETGGRTVGAGYGFIQNIELRSLDSRFRLRGPRPHDDRIIIVDIDEKTLQRVGAWPIPRSAYARAVDQLAAGGARVIAFDVAFPTPEKNSAVEALKRLEQELGSSASPVVIQKIREIQGTSDNDVILAESLKKANNVVLGHIFLDAERAKSQDHQAAEDYYFVLSDKPFPQLRKVSGGSDFDLDRSWEGKVPGDLLEPEAPSRNAPVYWGIESNIRILAEAARSYGFFNNNPDPDGVMRHAVLLVRYQKDKGYFASLPFQALTVYEDIKPAATAGYIAENGMERIEAGPYRFFTQRDASGLINFTGPYGTTYKHYSMADVIDGAVAPSTFNGKIVLVGATAIGIGDLRTTPFDALNAMGVEVHANALDNMLNSSHSGRGFLSRGDTEVFIDVALILVLGLGLGYLFGWLKPLNATLLAIAALVLFGAGIYIAFAKLGMWLSFVVPAGTVMANYAAITSFRMIFEEREKRKIRKSFASYVAPSIISLIEKDPKKYLRTGGEMRELTIMFSDIRSFTTISEGMSPDDLVHFLNEYLGEMTDIIFKRWGTLDKYIGDAVMAFWGSPYPQEDHAVRACAAALDMSTRLEELNMKWEALGKKPISTGIGLNTGPVNVGNMGSDKRYSWTVMGDHVNLASRLEGQTKDYRCRVIVGEGTFVRAKDHYVFRDLDKIRVKGKLVPVNIYELLAFAKDASHYQDLLHQWDAALLLYRVGQWQEAINKLEELLHKYPDDGPSHTLLHRCHEKIAEGVPAGVWDGVYVAKSK
jgi:adenylate cyclase